MSTENVKSEVALKEEATLKEEKAKPTGLKKWLKRFGVVGFWFFFIKGLLWIVVAVAAYYGFKVF